MASCKPFTEFLDPFTSHGMPHRVEDVFLLDEDSDVGGKICAVEWNRTGCLLACGAIGGRVVAFDILTRGVAADWTIAPATMDVSNLSWSHDGSLLLAVAKRWIKVDGAPRRGGHWDVHAYLIDVTKTEDSVIFDLDLSAGLPPSVAAESAQLHPFRRCCLVNYEGLAKDAVPPPPRLIDLGDCEGASEAVPMSPNTAARPTVACFLQHPCSRASDDAAILVGCGDTGAVEVRAWRGWGSFATDGSSPLPPPAASHALPGAIRSLSQIPDLETAGSNVLICAHCNAPKNCRALAVFRVTRDGSGASSAPSPAPALLPPPGSAWRIAPVCDMLCPPLHDVGREGEVSLRTCISWDQQSVIGCYRHSGLHQIYVWCVNTRTVIKIIEASSARDRGGVKKLPGMWDVAWCPHQALFVTVAKNGLCYVWSKKEEENWSMFAPGFRELKENEEYSEREDEFDTEIMDPGPDTLTKRSMVLDNEAYHDGPLDMRSVPSTELWGGDYKIPVIPQRQRLPPTEGNPPRGPPDAGAGDVAGPSAPQPADPTAAAAGDVPMADAAPALPPVAPVAPEPTPVAGGGAQGP